MFVSTTIQSISNAITSIANYLTKKKEVQLESDIIEDKKSLKKASDIAEKMFKIVLKYIDIYDNKDRKHLEKLYDDFLEKN